MARSAVTTPAAATTSRVRNKKLSYKQKLCVQRGSHLLNAANSVVAGPEPEFEGHEHAQDSNLGVDSSEISEHHLQAALSSNQLATADASSQDAAPKVVYSIPTPEARGVLSAKEFSELYPSGAYQDPVTYIRWSDTVEDAIRGPTYCMDEDDQDWLDTRNSKAREELALAMRNIKPGAQGAGGAKGKGKERVREDVAAKLTRDNQAMLRIMSEDQFEMIVTVFEQITSDRVPFLHLDMAKMPTLDEMLPSFEPDSALSKLAQPELPPLPWEESSTTAASSSASGSSTATSSNGATTSSRRQASNAASSPQADLTEWKPENPYKNLADLKALAGVVYPYWKSKREDREGKAVVASLNFDETNDSDPYVCFRRREVKQMRKTRKTDALHIEKLIRLRTELDHAASLVQLIAQREKTKRASLRQGSQCWESARALVDIKRQWGIAGPHQGLEDDELLSGERRDIGGASSGAPKKKRKTEEGSTTIRLPNRKSRNGEGESGSAGPSGSTAGAAAGVHGMGSAILERVHAVQAYIDRECLRKADADLGWEEGSDLAFQPVPAPAALRAFRPIHSETSEDRSPFAPLPSRVGRPPSFRRRVGRGGRVFLDRRLPTPSPVPSHLADWPRYGDRSGNWAARGSTGAGSSQSEQPAQSRPSAQPEPSASENLHHQATLRGPFAFTPDLRPSLLTSSQRPLPAAVDVEAGTSPEGPFGAPAATTAASSSGSGTNGATTGPFAFAAGVDAQSQASDASSTSSDSTDRSHSSLSSIGAASTQATEVGDIDMLGLDGVLDKREDESDSESDGETDTIAAPGNAQGYMADQWARFQERWRYDDESGRWAGLGLTGLGGMEDDEEAVLDDFDQKFMRYRMTLLEETDLLKLSTDLTNLQHAQAAAEAPSPKPAGYVQQSASTSAGSAATASRSTGGAGSSTNPASAVTVANNISVAMPSAARTAAVTGGGGSQSAIQAQQLQAQQQQLQLAMQQQAQQQQAAQAVAAAQQSAAAQQVQQMPFAQQSALQQAQLAAMAAATQQQQQQQQQQQAQQRGGASSPVANAQQRRMSGLQVQHQQQMPFQTPVQGQGQQLQGQQAAQVAMQMQLPIQMQMQMQMQMAAAAAASGMPNQPHPLSQSMSFDASGIQAHQVPRSMPAAAAAHSSPLQAAGFVVPSTQPYGNGLGNGVNGLVGSPAMHAARMSAQPQQHVARTSSSPVSAANGSGQNGARPTPSPVMHASMAVPQQMQRQNTGGAPNSHAAGQGAQANQIKHANGFHALQALQQAQQAQPFVGQGGTPSTPQQAAREAQLMAMKAVLAQNANLQLRLPPNRALQIAQQAAQAALGQSQQLQQQQQHQQAIPGGQAMVGQGSASNQGSPNMMRASSAGSPRAKNVTTANGVSSNSSPSPRAGQASRAGMMAQQAMNGQMQFASAPGSNLQLSASQQQAMQQQQQQQQQQQMKAGNMGMANQLGMAGSPNTGHAKAQHAATPNHG
ncbi:uncharacterized protein PFL1_02368 [Pseudozyma flocculosa PF-1]|uniref:uncharacterized protein n=1 Tax=Pseudozyma flocculosa PF-1 TaxID=1277687 RepID=UPI0004560543|nr:uncharacterized protein PFL1_02368 [Pseudozyma flocculosa PF-1]EPQ30252.1 hypothetical protein PFL1_02368 [Pseudozyma flocculosa PF-1]